MIADNDKERLLALMHVEFAFVERTLARLTPEQMLIPDVVGWWSVKDTIAHITAWERRLIGWLHMAQNGRPPEIPERGFTWDQIDALNERASREDQDRPLDDVLADFRRTHHQIVEMVEKLSQEELFEDDFDGMIAEPPWALIVGNTYAHYYEHITAVRQWIDSLENDDEEL